MTKDTRLIDHTAFVTGGNTGIGSAIAGAPGSAAANVAINCISHHPATRKIEEEIRQN